MEMRRQKTIGIKKGKESDKWNEKQKLKIVEEKKIELKKVKEENKIVENERKNK